MNFTKKIKIKYSSSLIDKSRKFPQTSRYLESISISERGNILSAISRGKLYTMGIWNGPVFQYGKMNGVRYKHNIFLKNDKKILTFSDQGNIEKFEIYNLENGKVVKRLKTDLGRALNVKKSPVSDMVAIINHKHELWIFDTSKDKGIKIDKSSHAMMQCNWSPDGKYIAYSCSKNSRTSIIKIYDISKKKSYDITKPISNDFSPVFDSNGKYLAFHSNRTFNPVYDSIQFDLNFTVSEKAYLVTLNEKVQSPFIKDPNYEDLKAKDKTKKDKKVKVEIDFKNIQNRIMEIPIKETILDNDIGFIDNKIFYLEWPVEGSRQDGWYDIDSKPKGILKYYDLNELEEKVFMANVSSFSINYKNSNILVKSGQSVRLLSTKAVPSKEVLNDPKFNKTTGLVDFNRIKLEVNVGDEWRQMYSEAWRLQRDHFWVSNMSNINFVHNNIDGYYNVEPVDGEIVKSVKDNTADAIISNVSWGDLKGVISSGNIEVDDKNGFSKSGNVVWYQVSLKKAFGKAQLGKVTSYIKTQFQLDSADDIWRSVLDEGFLGDILSNLLILSLSK